MRRLFTSTTLSWTTALIGAAFAFGSSSASAGGYGQPGFRPVMGHHGMASPGYRPSPMSYGHGPRVVTGSQSYASHGYGAQGFGSQRYGAPRMIRSGPAVYSMRSASPRFGGVASGYDRPRYAGGYGDGRYGRGLHGDRRYGYGLAAATIGAVAGYGYGGGYGSNAGYGEDTASNGYATEGGYDAAEQPLTVRYGATPSYGYGQQLSGGDDVQTNNYASPYNPYQQTGYAAGGGYGLSSVGFGVGIPPAGGLAVYSPGAYGPGPAIINVPAGYGYGGSTGCTCRAAHY